MTVLSIEFKKAERVYATESYLTNDIEMVVDVMYADLLRKSGKTSSYISELKKICDNVREDLETENLIGLTPVKNVETGGDLVLVQVYPIKAQDGLSLDMFFDKELNQPYVYI